MSYLYDHTFFTKKQRLQTHFIKAISSEELDSRSPLRNGEIGSTDNGGNNLVKTGAGLFYYYYYFLIILTDTYFLNSKKSD